jgi:hypothetical protein
LAGAGQNEPHEQKGKQANTERHVRSPCEQIGVNEAEDADEAEEAKDL